ncbi:MAG: hypothetical protein OXC14_06185 [Rhodospirillaceae bacterium]|nr:hypothetical protein [Rhodospirillaceae bacterium]
MTANLLRHFGRTGPQIAAVSGLIEQRFYLLGTQGEKTRDGIHPACLLNTRWLSFMLGMPRVPIKPGFDARTRLPEKTNAYCIGDHASAMAHGGVLVLIGHFRSSGMAAVDGPVACKRRKRGLSASGMTERGKVPRRATNGKGTPFEMGADIPYFREAGVEKT